MTLLWTQDTSPVSFNAFLALAALMLLMVPLNVAAQEQARDEVPPVAPNDKVVFHIVDQNGSPVAGARVGTKVDWSMDTGKPNSSRPRVFLTLNPEGGDAVSSHDGAVSVLLKHLFPKNWPADRPIALHAIHPEKKLVAIRAIVPSDVSERIVMKLTPWCYVRGAARSKALEQAGQPLRKCEIWVDLNDWNRTRLIECSSYHNQFDFVLPAGHYRIGGLGTEATTGHREIDILPGNQDLEIVLDLNLRLTASLVGKSAPELRNIKGWLNTNPLRLSDLHGKVVLLDFWGCWCGPCVRKMPQLIELHKQYAKNGLIVIAIHDNSIATVNELAQTIKLYQTKFWGGQPLPFAVALDDTLSKTAPDYRGATIETYMVKAFPTYVLIDRKGKIVHCSSEIMEPAKLEVVLGINTPDWRKRFAEVYSLGQGEIIKRIAPPFIPERTQYQKDFGWNEPFPNTSWFRFDGWDMRDAGVKLKAPNDLGTTLRIGLELRSYEFDLPPELEKMSLPGDWIVNSTASQGEKLKALAEIIRCDFGKTVRFEKSMMDREVVVVRGRFSFHPIKSAEREKRFVYLVDDPNAYTWFEEGNGTLEEMLKALGDSLGTPVLDMTDRPGPGLLTWALRSIPQGAARQAKLKQLLKSISHQTNLTFEVGRRTVGVWVAQMEN